MMCVVRLLRPLLAAVAATAIGAVVALSAPAPAPSARAQGYAALLPAGAQGGVTASSGGPVERSSGVSGLRPAGGGSVSSVDLRVEARADGTSATADATVSATGLSLLDGRVSIASLRMSGHAGAGPSGGRPASRRPPSPGSWWTASRCRPGSAAASRWRESGHWS